MKYLFKKIEKCNMCGSPFQAFFIGYKLKKRFSREYQTEILANILKEKI